MNQTEKIIKAILSILALFCIFLIAIIGYDALYQGIANSDYAYFFGYTHHTVNTDSMAPDYKVNDLLILKKNDYYQTDEVIVINYKGSYTLVKVTGYNGKEYIVDDNTGSFNSDYKIKSSNIIGTVAKRYRGIAKVIDILTSVYSGIVLIILLVMFGIATLGREKNGN